LESKKLIRDFIINNFLFGSTDANFSDDDSFLETSIIDSTGMLELVPENLDSINRLASFIEKKNVSSAS
jgi:hypothetical protein